MLKQNMQYPDIAQLRKPLEIDSSAPVGNNFARGLTYLLRYAGCTTDYVTVMGDIGEAFTMGGTEYDDRLTGGYADLGWWQFDRWHIISRLPFLSWVNGVELHHFDVDFGGVAPDPAKSYARLFQKTVCHEITQGKVLLACWDFCHVVTGYDTGKPPLLGWDLTGDDAVNKRMSDYPCAITTYGSPCEAMDRSYADRMALRHAVELGHGGVKCGLWVTGPAAWKGWEEHLLHRNTEFFWHGSIIWGLKKHRSAAVQYLESMALRHSEAVPLRLREAAEIYRQQLEVINQMVVSPELGKPGKEQAELADLIRQAAALDLEAISSIEAAVSLLPE
jgi:hypothetical protein